MLWTTKELAGLELAARDGDIGRVRRVDVDAAQWAIRHLVVDTGGWFGGRDVLISPHAVERLDASHHRLELALTRRQVEDAPGVETDEPVSRGTETAIYDHYGYPYYWTGGALWGDAALPMLGAELAAAPTRTEAKHDEAAADAAGPHLARSDDIVGCAIEATDGRIGHVEDLLFDERSWQVRYAVVDTGDWLPGRRVLVATDAIDELDLVERVARVRLARAAVKDSPPYHPEHPQRAESIARVQRYYEGWQ